MSENSSLILTARRFLSRLRNNNNREWFLQHKNEYETTVKKPALFFCDLISAELEDLTGMPHNPKVFRINRDVRFSKDKTPYNSHLHMLWTPDSKQKQVPGWFLGISPDYVKLGGGMMAFEPSTLANYRERVAKPDASGLISLQNSLVKNGFSLAEPELKRVPTVFGKDHPHGELLRRKGLVFWKDIENDVLEDGADLLALTMSGFKKHKPANDWLMTLG